jgi:mono/diheme cytochrome c family protein
MPPILSRAIPASGRSRLLLGLALVVPATLFGAVGVPAPPSKDKGVPQYNRDIRPILAENCFACHGPDKAARKADLRLDIRKDALEAGVIVPHKPGESPLVERIFSTDKKKMMPTPKSHKTLTADQKETLRRWVAAGAEYQQHWSFLPPTRAAAPAVKDASWVRNPIDSFILEKLERRGMTPAAEADRRSLARRVSFDATGLPPAIADVEAFVADTRPDAYERYVDKVLASPHWGEHRGRFWLDAARYADTHGIHFDNQREMWSYREWVIDAFNKDMPFDQFTVEQLAGDLLPNRTVDQQIASGFNRCNITTNEGGAINEEYLVLYTRDRTETVSQVWMALTTGCAVCHDHKFDPVSQKEFYQLAAYFNNTTQAAMDGNIKDTPPIIFVPTAADRPRWNALVATIDEARKQVAARKEAARPEFVKWLASVKPGEAPPAVSAEGLTFQAMLSEGTGSKTALVVAGKSHEVSLITSAKWAAGRVSPKALVIGPKVHIADKDAGDFDRTQPFTVAAWVNIPAQSTNGAILARMDDANAFRGWDLWVEGDKVGMHIINKWPGNAVKVVSRTPLKANTWQHVVVSHDGSGKAAGIRIFVDGKLQKEPEVQADNLTGTTRTKVPLKIAQRDKTSRINNLKLQDIRLYSRTLADAEAVALSGGDRLKELLARASKLTPAEKDELYGSWLRTEDATSKKLAGLVEGLVKEQDALRARGTIALVSQEKMTKPMANILFRGDYDKKRDAVAPGTPAVLPAMPAKLPRNRLGLAQWLVQPGHPLTARVTVNRFWQEVFGNGIVRTSGDFGIAGDQPTHPELLDWLALEFQENGWDVKHLFRLMLTSATYRQSAQATPEKREKDPANVYLSRGPRFRLDAEVIRDNALAVSGLLTEKFGGPSVRPYQPDGVWEAVAMIGSNTRDYRRDAGDKLYRRSMYTFWKRAAPPASMDIFNAPAREYCVVRRERTNTPLQALVTLNDEQHIEAARVLAEKTLGTAQTTDGRLDFLTKTLISRPLRAEERKIAVALLGELLGHYKAAPAEAKKLLAVGETKSSANLDAPTLAGWTMLTNSLMNLDEVLNK